MLKSGAVVLNFEGFPSKKIWIYKKKLALSTKNYNDTISFSPSNPFHILSLSKQRSFLWISNFFMVSRGRQESTLIIICNRFFKV